MRVFLDPGHGLPRDPGAVGPGGLREAAAAYRFAVMLAGELLREGAVVSLSRDVDEDPSQRTRAGSANSFLADVFVSCHFNGFSAASANGAEVLFWAESRVSPPVAKSLLDSILVVMGPLGVRSRGVKAVANGGRGATVLRDTRMPAVILEPAFITNPAEESIIGNLAVMSRLARSLAGGILRLEV